MTFDEKQDLIKKNTDLKAVYGLNAPSLPRVLRKDHKEISDGHTKSVLQGVMYYSDGSGYPGCPASLTVEYVTYKDHKGHCIDLWPILYCVPEIVDTLETMGWEYLD
jgi:hypothetical protein